MGRPPLHPTLQAQISLPLDSKDLTIPNFATLYKHLLAEYLDESDNSTISQNKQYEARGTEQDLHVRHIDMVRDALLVRVLREICVYPSIPSSASSMRSIPDLDVRVREPTCLMSEYITAGLTGMLNDSSTNSSTTSEIHQLMAPQIRQFEENLPNIAPHLNNYISELETTLTELATLMPSPPPPPTHPSSSSSHWSSSSPPSSSSSSSILAANLTSQQSIQSTTIPTLLNTLISTLHTLLTTQTTLLSISIHTLETHTFSTSARNLTTHATFLSTVSAGIALKTRILTLLDEKSVYAENGVRDALKVRWTELCREEKMLTEREAALRALMAEYAGVTGSGGGSGNGFDAGVGVGFGNEDEDENRGGEQVMRTLGREYSQIEKEISAVMEDIVRLEEERSAVAGGGGVRTRNSQKPW